MEQYKGLSAGMKILLGKAEELDWWWKAWIEENQNNRTYVEIGQYSPAGEDFSMTIDFDAENQCESFLDNLEEYYNDFDPDEHAEEWVEARRNRVRAVPAISVLVEDSAAIDAMIWDLFKNLQDAEVEDDG